MITIEVTGDAVRKLDEVAEKLKNPRPLFADIAGMLESQTEDNFATQSWGSVPWKGLANSTIARRRKGKGGISTLEILQDSGILAGSIGSYYDDTFAAVGSNVKYAAIHQFGGSVTIPAHNQKTRLRTNAKGELLDGKARFAKQTGPKAHKRYREYSSDVKAYSINIDARPYLPFRMEGGAGMLQPEVKTKLLDIINRFLSEGMR